MEQSIIVNERSFIDDDNDSDDGNAVFDYDIDLNDLGNQQNVQQQQQSSIDERLRIVEYEQQRNNHFTHEYLFDKILKLQNSCNNYYHQIQTLEYQLNKYNQQLYTFKLLYLQEKQSKQKLSRLLQSNQRELEYYRRHCKCDCNLSNNSANSCQRNKMKIKQKQQQQPHNTLIIDHNFDVNNIGNEQTKKLIMRKKPNEFHGIFFDMTVKSGVIIRQVLNRSEAYKAGLRKGDRILEIAGINMRSTNYRIAEKILSECLDDEEIIIKIHFDINKYESDLSLYEAKSRLISSNHNNNNNNNQSSIKNSNRSSLVRRNAFKQKDRSYSLYCKRKHNEKLLLYENLYIHNINKPRRIYLKSNELYQNLRLCGGNAIGIFIFNINNYNDNDYNNDESNNRLQIGDQLLEYNKHSLTNVTAEDASLQLAKYFDHYHYDFTNNNNNDIVELIVLFNIDVFQQIKQNPIGDSFYIRTRFDYDSLNMINNIRDNNLLIKFNKGDIFYIDNTLYDGKPCKYWRAYKLNQYGQFIEHGFIPSEYNNDFQMLESIYNDHNDIDSIHGDKIQRNRLRLLWQFFQRFLSSKPYNKRNNSRLLASFSIDEDDDSCHKIIENQQQNNMKYCRIKMSEQNKPQPVIIFGPYNYLIIKLLIKKYPTKFALCPKMISVVTKNDDINELEKNSIMFNNQCNNYELISVKNIHEIQSQNKHPIILTDDMENCLEKFHQKNFHPILFELKFTSSKYIRIFMNNKYLNYIRINDNKQKISRKTAKNIYKYHSKISKKNSNIKHLSIICDNLDLLNILYQIQRKITYEQNKLIWLDL